MIEIALIVVVLLLAVNIYFYYRNSKRGVSARDFEQIVSHIESSLKDEFTRNRAEMNENSKGIRQEIAGSFKTFSDIQSNQMNSLTASIERRLDKMTETIESKLKGIQDDNNLKLEKMRETVDEKLQSTLDKRLAASFNQVSERLEQVHKGLGEMQTLATGVGDLKKVLTNVKTRGVLGEYQLHNILEQILTVDQYSRNVKTKISSDDNVEFAVRLPGRDNVQKTVWLPIDSKFPKDDYELLASAYDKGDASLVEDCQRKLANRVKTFAKSIRDKYLDPPNTTDFGIMFLPFEGLYAEVLRMPGLMEILQREFKVIITGPTTLSAILNSLQMGFRTLAIEKRTSEVWELLGAVKTEFGVFGSVLDKTKRRLEQAADEIERAGTRSRSIEKKLREVQELPSSQAGNLLEAPPEIEEDEENLF
jgi:DNA recombination protein RmuC